MSVSRIVLVLVSVGLVSACENALAPDYQSAAARPVYAAVHEGGTGIIVGTDIVDPGTVECVGEALSFTLSVPYSYHTTLTPNGQVIFVDHYLAAQATGTAVGVSTGTVWTLKVMVSPEVIRTAAGSSWTYTGTSLWESESSTIQFHFRYHMSQDAGGEIKVDEFDNSCRLF